MNYHCLVRPSMALYGPFHGLLQHFHDVSWPLNGLLWQNIDSVEIVLSFLAVIDPNSFGLVITHIR